MYEIDTKKINELSSEFLKTFLDYWNGLSPDKRAGSFLGNGNVIIMKELVFSGIPVQIRLRVLRLSSSSPARVIAEAASQGIKMSIITFQATEDMKYDEKHVAELSESYVTACKELYYEIRDYV